MADARNALALHGGGGREERAGGGENDPIPLSLPHTAQKVAVERRGGAAAAAAAHVHVLPLKVIEQHAAVLVVFRHVHAVAREKVHDYAVSELPEVAGHDEVIVRGRGPRVGKEGAERFVGRGG